MDCTTEGVYFTNSFLRGFSAQEGGHTVSVSSKLFFSEESNGSNSIAINYFTLEIQNLNYSIFLDLCFDKKVTFFLYIILKSFQVHV